MNVPALRFKEFKDCWNEWMLKDISDIKTGPFGSSLHEEDYSKTGTPIITVEHLGEQGLVHNKLPLVNDVDKARLKSYILKKGDIVFSRVGSVDRSCLISHKEDGWMFSGRLLRVRLNNVSFCSKFLNQNFKNEVVKYRIRSVAVGQTMASLNTEILKNFTLMFPASVSEQIKIANFLTAVDEKIQQLSQKNDLLTQYKKGVMQQIFSQELRFKDDDGGDFPEWALMALSDISIKKSSNIAANKIEDNEGEYKIYGASGVLKKVDFFTQDSSYISIVKDGAGVGRVFLCEPLTSVLGTMDIIQPKENINISFLLSLLEKIDFVIYVTGSTIPHIYYKDYSKEIVGVPSLKEQTKIANFLTAIDDKITAVQTQLEAVKKYKQGLLQQMFV